MGLARAFRSPLTWQVLARRGWLLGLGLMLGIGVSWAISGIAVSASSSFSVRTTERVQTPYEAERLALTYARLIPSNPAVVGAIGNATALSPDYVEDHLTMVAQPETSIVFARFTASDAETAKAALGALATATRRASDSAGTSLHRTLVPISAPVVAGGFSPRKGIALGALAGLGLAFALVLTLERRRPRIDDLDDLATIVPVPVSLIQSSGLAGHADENGRRRTARRTEAVVRVETAALGNAFGEMPLNASPAGEPCSLVIERGAPVVEVEDAWRDVVSSGSFVSRALLLRRGSFLHRLPGIGHGSRQG